MQDLGPKVWMEENARQPMSSEQGMGDTSPELFEMYSNLESCGYQEKKCLCGPLFFWTVLSLGHPFPYVFLYSVTLVCTIIPRSSGLATKPALGKNTREEIAMRCHFAIKLVGCFKWLCWVLVKVLWERIVTSCWLEGGWICTPFHEGHLVSWYLKLLKYSYRSPQ